MNIIWIDGGLGNQMFQYALALKQESLGRPVALSNTEINSRTLCPLPVPRFITSTPLCEVQNGSAAVWPTAMSMM